MPLGSGDEPSDVQSDANKTNTMFEGGPDASGLTTVFMAESGTM
jgi:hypothetical protein